MSAPKAKLPKGRVLFANTGPGFMDVYEFKWMAKKDEDEIQAESNSVATHVAIPVAVIPTLTRAQAARIARVANMTEGERVEMVAKALAHGHGEDVTDGRHGYMRDAQSILSALGLATGGKA